MSTPPCISGAVIMKMTSNNSMTSIRLTTFTSAFSSKRCRLRRRAISDLPFAHEQRDHGGAEALHPSIEAVEAARENVVAERRRNRDAQRRRGRDQRLGDTRRDRREIAGALRRDA